MTTRWFRVAWPLALLLVCVGVVRNLSVWMRPATPAVDCDRASQRALPALEQCIALHSEDAELLTETGLAYERLAAWDRAETAYRRALEIDPQDGDVHVRLGEVLLSRGDLEGARREAGLAMAVQPGRAAALDLMRRAAASGDAGLEPGR